MENKFGIFWFRQDLRLHDNLALFELAKKCTKIIPIYIYDDNSKLGSASKWWLYNSLKSLDQSLTLKDSQLFYFKGNPLEILNHLILKNSNISEVSWNRLYDKYSIKRDKLIKVELNKININVETYNGSLINEPWIIKNKAIPFLRFLLLFGTLV